MRSFGHAGTKLAAAILMAWLVARAHLQSITIDEAVSFSFFVDRGGSLHWYPAAANHVLQTMLSRLSVMIFGISHLSLRLPTLLAAAVYIAISLRFCARLTKEPHLQLAAFIALAANPFVADYLVAARGYGIATAALLAALWVGVGEPERGPAPLARRALFSVLLAIAFAANFSFAFVCFAVVAAVIAGDWMVRAAGESGERWRLAAFSIWPGLLTFLFLSSSVVWNWPPGQLWIGAKSIAETVRSVADASLYEPNSDLLNPWMLSAAGFLKPWLLPGVGLAAVVYLISLGKPKWEDLNLRVAGISLSVVVLALGIHWACFLAFGLLLPKDRTAIYVAPLVTLAVCSVAAIEPRGRLSRTVRTVLTGAILLTAGYFVSCMRLTYFTEWWWDAEVRQAYDAVAYYHHRCGIQQVPANWHYAPSLNFYIRMSGKESWEDFPHETPYPAGRALYVLHSAFDKDFLAQEKLDVVYRGTSTEIVVAARPGLLGDAGSCAGASLPRDR